MDRPPGAIVFDLDGTLVDTLGVRLDAWMETFPRFGIEPERSQIAPLLGLDGRLLARAVAEACGRTLEPDEASRLDQMAGDRFGELNADPRPLPAAREILEALTRLGVAWAVATSSRPEEARASVASLGLRAEPLICDGADVEHAKPAPDLLLKAAHLLEVDPGATWYVGDARWDMLAAAAAGMRAIAVLTGATGEAELRDAGADVVYPTLRELLDDLPKQLPADHRTG